jgi:DinB superfamily
MYTKQEITSCLMESSKSFLATTDGMNADKFFTPVGKSQWSPAQHMDHLTRASGAVCQAFALPRFVLGIFGTPNRPGRTYDELKKRYLEKLESGGKASGRYIPSVVNKANRDKLRSAYQKKSEKLLLKVTAMKEHDFDTYLLPHPLLGKITIREMLFFTIYHTYHHLDIVNKKGAS